MSQDTRKDKRAKVVSLNVRYKSATVDEFIENHSHDVSKGGIFVKTPTPFPPGTLLKFEIRLAGDKSVISGVGRVAWKREPTQAAADKPAGMGVKFIKIDDASRAVIDRLVASKVDAGSAYTSDPAALEEEGKLGTTSIHPTTLRGLSAAPPVQLSSPPVAVFVPAARAPSLSAPAASPPAATPSSAPDRAPAKAQPAPAPAAAPSSSPAAAPIDGGASGAGRPAGKLDKTIPMGALPPTNLPRPAAPVPPPRASAPPPAARRPATVLGVAPPPRSSGAASPAAPGSSSPVERSSEPRGGAPAAPPPPAQASRKATMMGVGLPAPPSPLGVDPEASLTSGSHSPPPNGGEATPAPKPASLMFPNMEPKREAESVKEPTVMKQAAELLEEALREAGGSMDEIGQNPLFLQSSPKGATSSLAGPSRSSTDASTVASPAKVGAPSSSSASALGDPAASSAKAIAAPPSAGARPSGSSPPASVPLRPIGESVRAEKKGAGGLVAVLFVGAVLVGGGVYAYKSGALAGVIGGARPEPSLPSAVPIPAPTTSASGGPSTEDASAAMIGDGAAAAAIVGADDDAGLRTAGADAGGVAAVDASAATDASAFAAAPVFTARPTPPRPRPRPPTPASTDHTESAPAPTTAPTTEPAPAPTATPAPAPTATAAPAPTATAAPEL